MSQSFVQVPPNSTGDMLAFDTWVANGNTVYGQDIVLYGPDGIPISTLSSAPTGGERAIVTRAVGLPPELGTWGYLSGVSGTVSVPTNGKVLGIAVHSTAGGSFTINGGNSIPVPANVGADLAPRGNLVAPTFIFTNTDSYIVEYVV